MNTTDTKHEEIMRELLATQGLMRKVLAEVRQRRESHYVGREEVAKRLGCSIRQTYRLIERGEIPDGIRMGSATKWLSDVIDDIVRKRGA